jgi:IPT/TIG domain
VSWSIKPAGSWGVATTSAPGSELAAALAKPGSWLWHPAANTVMVRKDQWGSLVAVPEVDNVTPAGGTTAGGTGVTVNGSGLIGSTGVTFGGTAATGFLVNADSTITCLTPAKTAGPVNVVVLNPRGNVTVTNGYTYV